MVGKKAESAVSFRPRTHPSPRVILIACKTTSKVLTVCFTCSSLNPLSDLARCRRNALLSEPETISGGISPNGPKPLIATPGSNSLTHLDQGKRPLQRALQIVSGKLRIKTLDRHHPVPSDDKPTSNTPLHG